MPKYEVTVSRLVFKTIEISAKNEDDLEKNVFKYLESDDQPDNYDDWEIDEFEKVKKD